MLAETLGMTVSSMREEMGQAEFTQWKVYFGRRAQRDEMARKKAARSRK